MSKMWIALAAWLAAALVATLAPSLLPPAHAEPPQTLSPTAP